jgi:hypothetical protein
MNKNKNIPVEEKSFVYTASEENLNKFKDHPFKLISDDKKFLLVYIQKDLIQISEYYNWDIEQQELAKSSLSDIEYENLLEETKIKKPFIYNLYEKAHTKYDEKIEKFIHFYDSKTEIGTIVCTLKELSSGKAVPKFVMVTTSLENFGKSIKEVTPNGYFTFKLRGSTNEK